METRRSTPTVLAGRYQLTGVLGRGGMGLVHRATDRVLGRTVAVKVLAPALAEDPAFVKRFEREALATAAISHPGIVSVYDFDQDGDTRFIVMECAPGENLAALLRRRRRLPPHQASAIAAAIADALAAAHRAGIVHRDVKPGNVMVDEPDSVKVLDFGIALALAGTALTQTSTVIGSAPYLPPEVIRGARADERSDIYSLGCVLYEMLSGRPPFSAAAPAAVLQQHCRAEPRPLRESVPDMSPALAAIVDAALAKDPADRPARARELAHQLRRLHRRPAAAPATAWEPVTGQVFRPWRDRAARRVGLAAATTVAVVLAGVTLSAGSSGTAPGTVRRAAHRASVTHTTAARPSQARRPHPVQATSAATTVPAAGKPHPAPPAHDKAPPHPAHGHGHDKGPPPPDHHGGGHDHRKGGDGGG